MNLLKLIKSKFKNEPIERSIILFDMSKIEIPKYRELSDLEKNKVKEYEQELKIEDFNCLMKYPTDIRIKGDNISKLLNELLYNLTKYLENIDIKISLGREIQTDPLELVNYLINAKKIKVLKEELNNLVLDTTLKIIAVREYIKKYKLINILKYKINDITHLKNLENTLIVSLIALKSEQMINKNVSVQSDDISSSLTKLANLNKYSYLIKNGCIRKLKYLEKINKYVMNNELDLDNISSLINNLTLNREEEVLTKLAKMEIEIDNYIKNNKDKLINYLKEELNALEESKITHENIYDCENKINKLIFIKNLFKQDISYEDIKRLYKIKFRIVLMNDKNTLNPFYFFDSLEEVLMFDEIVRDEVNTFLSLRENDINNIKEELVNRYLVRIIQRKFNKISKDNKDDIPNKIRASAYLIEIIYMVNHPGYYQEIFNKFIRKMVDNDEDRTVVKYDMFYVLYDDKIYTDLNGDCLYLDETVLIILKKIYEKIYYLDKEEFFDLEKEFIALLLILLNNKYRIENLASIHGDTLSFREGVTEIRGTEAIIGEADFILYMTENTKYMRSIKHINLPSTLKVIGENTFYRYDLETVDLPDNLERIEEFAFDMKIMEKLRSEGKFKVKR